MQIDLVDVANLPASGLQELVNLKAGFGFGSHSVKWILFLELWNAF
jgi:hypothetical protein